MSLVYLPQESTPATKDSLWSLTWAGPHLVSGSADGVVRIYDAGALRKPETEDPTAEPVDTPASTTGIPLLTELPSLPLAVSSLSSTGDGKYALATALDGTVGLIDLGSRSFVDRIETGRVGVTSESGSEVPAYAAAIHPEGKAWACVGRGSKLAIRTISTLGEGALAGEGAVVDTTKGRFGMSVAFSPDGAQVAVGFETGHVSVIDTETRAVLATYSAHAMAVRALAWSPDSQWLYSGADDARIVLHDVRAGGSGARGEGAVAIMQGHRGWVLSAAASPDGKLLATGSADATVKLWDVAQRTCVGTNNADAEVWGVAWQPEYEGSLPPGKQFAIAGDDKKVSLFRAAGAV